jgi:hypothetical protein
MQKASSRDEAFDLLFLVRTTDSCDACPPSEPYTLNDDPQPQVLFTFGFSNLKPAPSRVST